MVFLAGLTSLVSISTILLEWDLLSALATPLKISIILDPAGLLYSATVLFIAANVIRFSNIYIKDDPYINRFTALVILFVASINILIFIPHFMALLLGWDGLGITSFILVVYYQNPKSLAAGIITALTNRIGDVLILISIALTMNQGHWNIIHIWDTPFIYIQVIIIMLAGCTKRAQIPFSSWLPAAIAAPTPVSALVHSSTLVTAGVFLLIRFYPFLHSLTIFSNILIFLAVSTIFIAGIRASTECDIKKIIALSTLRQLGVIITRLALGAPNIALFHIITHALFKALLFICAGELIALHGHGQELRWIGNINYNTPVATSCILVANSALCGLPFLAGFYSKDLIIELFLVGGFNFLILLLSLIAVGFTALYSIRFSLVVLWGPRNFTPFFTSGENHIVTIPIILIALISISAGSFMLWLLPTYVSPFIIPNYIKRLVIILVLTGIIIGHIISTYTSPSNRKLINNYLFNYASCSIWFLTPLSRQPLLKTSINLAHHLLKTTDHAWLELLGPLGINMTILTKRTTIQSNTVFNPSRLILRSVIGSLSIILIIYLTC